MSRGRKDKGEGCLAIYGRIPFWTLKGLFRKGKGKEDEEKKAEYFLSRIVDAGSYFVRRVFHHTGSAESVAVLHGFLWDEDQLSLSGSSELSGGIYGQELSENDRRNVKVCYSGGRTGEYSFFGAGAALRFQDSVESGAADFFLYPEYDESSCGRLHLAVYLPTGGA